MARGWCCAQRGEIEVQGENGAGAYYRHHVFCCVNQRPEGNARGCCASKGAAALRNYMKGRARKFGLGDVRINQAGCLDRCVSGPTMVVYPEGIWYRASTKQDIDEILQSHLRDGRPVERLILRNDD
jgi:(2Fe-2S) ferredoxin